MELENLSAKELETLKQEWYKNGQENIRKLYSIARNLGENVPHNYGPKYRFQECEIVIYVDDYGGYMTVHLQDRLIVSTHNERLYVPGEWEQSISHWFERADQIRVNKEQAREQKEKDALLKSLTPTPKSNLHPLFEQILKPYMP